MKDGSSFLNDALHDMPVRDDGYADSVTNQPDTEVDIVHENDQIFAKESILDNQVNDVDIWLTHIDKDHQEKSIDDLERHKQNTALFFDELDIDDYWTII